MCENKKHNNRYQQPLETVAVKPKPVGKVPSKLLLGLMAFCLAEFVIASDQPWMFSEGSHQVTRFAEQQHGWLDTTGMDNQALAQSAANIRDNRLNSAQRLMNYQWLKSTETARSVRHNHSGARELLRRGFRYYWQQNRTDSTQAANAASASAIKDSSLNYNVRVSKKRFRLSINYAF